jgi:CHAT domain-containing protein
MERFLGFIFVFFCALVINAQKADNVNAGQQAEIERQAHYKEVMTQIFKDDELFVLFYLNLALVVDPTKKTQVVEPITTDNPWESLIGYIKGKSNIYFCPSGSQLSIAIEYMPCPIDPDILMSDRYGMYRLSSPEELFKNRGDSFRNSKHKAVVFGGLKYDEESKPTNDNLLVFRGSREAIEGYKYLKSTYEEAVYIDSIFRRNEIETALLTGEDGTERNFAQIPNHQVDILHIASHGFYEPDKDNTESTSLQEWMMSHAGLVLSGAEKESLDKANDGRLTAYEISQTDLSGVNLVVLSACDTGLGDIKENDVYGLIKGFKKAGAGTLLVTLSEVNDTVTSLLMKRFYDNIFRGDNPRRALENAQRYIRLHGNGQFNKIEYWSPFVLVDDLDRNIGFHISDTLKNVFLKEFIEIDNIYSDSIFFPNWELIRQNLSPSDAVIRFFSYKADIVDNYVAMIGDVSDGHCDIVRLFSIKDNRLGEYHLTDSTGKNLMYCIPFEYMDSILWRPILPIILPKHNVYFQPAGILNLFPIEGLHSVVDTFKIYRLSSLNRLFDSKMNIRFRDNTFAVLFGGLDYELTNNISNSFPIESLDRGAIYFSFLYGTKVETDRISEMLRKRGQNCLLYQGTLGTEHAYRELFNGRDISIIHLSTHSIYFDGHLENVNSISSYLLNLHGIALSGINVGGEIQNDGCLNGVDIANLDHSKVQLVTLSMCRSHFGTSEMTDTPWDLVKAFKMAGVKAILSPLWSVHDEATATLMVEFYKHFVSGYTLNESLEYAKMSVRSCKEKGWDAPSYWASFVLIDAIE